MTPEIEPGLKQVLVERLRLRSGHFDPGPLFVPKKLAQAVKDIKRSLGDVQIREPRKFELEETYRAVWSTWEEKRSLEGLGRRDLKRVPWVLFWKDQQRNRKLAADSSFLQSYAKWLRQVRCPSAVGALVRVLLQYYPAELPTFGDLLQIARTSVAASSKGRLRNWRERHQQFQLFSENGPDHLGKLWLDSDGKDSKLLERAGLVEALEKGEFVRRATRYLLKGIARRLTDDALSAEQLRALLDSMLVERHLRIEGLWRDTISALLLPFESRKPVAELEKCIREFTLRHVGDPRIGASRWQGLEKERQIMLRWLAKVTLDQFFRLLAETAQRDDHWEDRKQFWSYYLERGAVSDAWIILGPSAQWKVVSNANKLQGSYGCLERAQDKSQSALLMKVGNVVVAEWTHNSTCAFWVNDNTAAPHLYLHKYTRDNLKDDADELLWHFRNWQSRAAAIIGQETGIRNTVVPDLAELQVSQVPGRSYRGQRQYRRTRRRYRRS